MTAKYCSGWRTANHHRFGSGQGMLRQVTWLVVVWLASPLQADTPQHTGVASCASSVCHGSVQPYPGSNILHNEFIIWQTDRHGNMHAKAYHKLLTTEARRIAEKLAIGPPEKAQECLVCHSDYVPEAQRGDEFQLSDGVGCEACHGGAENYLASHTNKQLTLEQKQADGLYPTWDPQARASLCLDCHMGSGDKVINHRIMGAGHPRLQFELDTFTYLQPHHQLDEDYSQRKGQQSTLQDWAIGQAVAASNLLQLLQDPQHGWRGVFVEPLLLDCHSCHKRMDGDRWSARASTGLGPGEMRLNDANLFMTSLLLSAQDKQAASQLRQQIRQLHVASTQSRQQLLAVSQQLQTSLAAAIGVFDSPDYAAVDVDAILAALEQQARQGEFSDYALAEQTAMGLVNLIAALERQQLVAGEHLQASVDQVFAAVRDEYAYQPRQLVQAITGLRNQLQMANSS